MGLLDWIKKGPEHAYQAGSSIRTIWKGDPYVDKASEYSVQASLGMSEKGYHSGLTFTPKEGEGKTTWHRPVQRRDHAMQESYKAFSGWVERHEAHLDSRQRSGAAAKKATRLVPALEQGHAGAAPEGKLEAKARPAVDNQGRQKRSGPSHDR
jgi:hypothetical protein